jgi:hypothetical protein
MKPAKTSAKIAWAWNLMRSSVEPHTIARQTAQNANWKSHLDSIMASERPMIPKASCGSP